MCAGDAVTRTTTSDSPSAGPRFTPLGIAVIQHIDFIHKSIVIKKLTTTDFNHLNLISEEVRGAARAEITSEKPPKRSGSIAVVMSFM